MSEPTEERFPLHWSKARLDWTMLGSLFVTSLILHAFAAAQTVTFSDSGDFLMALSTVGNCHGPGYPLYLMSAKCFSLLVPFGSLAFRASLYSAVFASLTACLIYWIVVRLSKSRVGGVVAALAYTFSYTIWYQSVIPETYAVNTFFIALLVVLILRWERLLKQGNNRSADNTLCLFALSYGLALANHFTVVFIFPAFLFFALATDYRSVVAPRNIARMAVFFVLGMLPYLYIPTAAFRGPAYNYGDPATLTGWIHHVTLYYQRGGLFSYPLRYFPARFGRYVGSLSTEFPYYAWLGVVGIVCSFAGRKRKYPVFLIMLFLFSLLPVMTYYQLESVLRAHFYYPSYLVFSIWIGLGAGWVVTAVWRVLAHRKRSVAIAAVSVLTIVFVLFTVVAVVVHYQRIDKRGYAYAYDMARDMLETAAQDGIIYVDSDNAFFTPRYLQVVERLRPDVRVVNPKAARVPGFLASDLLDRFTAAATVAQGDPSLVQGVERNYSDHAVYSTAVNQIIKDWGTSWLGYLVRVFPPGSSPDPTETVHTELQQPGNTAYLDSDAREAVIIPRALKANLAFASKDYRVAGAMYDELTTFFLKNMYVPTLYSCETCAYLFEYWGEALNTLGQYKESVGTMPRAYEVNPDFISLTLAFAYKQEGQYGAALAQLNKYLAFSPGDANALEMKGEVYLDQNKVKAALQELQQAVAAQPTNQRALYYYGLALKRAGRKQDAVKQFDAVIKIDPLSEWAISARNQLTLIQGGF